MSALSNNGIRCRDGGNRPSRRYRQADLLRGDDRRKEAKTNDNNSVSVAPVDFARHVLSPSVPHASDVRRTCVAALGADGAL